MNTLGFDRRIRHLQRYAASGCRRIIFRLSTMGDPMGQLRRLMEELLPQGRAHQRFGLLNCCVSCARTLEIIARAAKRPSAKS